MNDILAIKLSELLDHIKYKFGYELTVYGLTIYLYESKYYNRIKYL